VAGEKILIVDSNTELIESIGEQILSPQGFKPLLAYSQNEGVKLAVSKSPQLLLLHLPVDIVTQTLQRIAQTGRLIPTILIMEQAALSMPVELLRLGVVDYVAQPFTAEDILQAVRRVLAREARSVNYQELAEDLTGFNQALEHRVKEFGSVLGPGGPGGSIEYLDTVLNRVIEAAVSITKADTGYWYSMKAPMYFVCGQPKI
jgi:DNA-binding NtrC family response regulator